MKKIIFVYNAESGIANSILDIGHKILKPDTYSCNLCSLTFGVLTENTKWKNFRKSSDSELEFLHKDEFERIYEERKNYPTILKLDDNNELEELVSKEKLNKINNIEELIQLIENLIK